MQLFCNSYFSNHQHKWALPHDVDDGKYKKNKFIQNVSKQDKCI